jgi:uncharacterized membrane protein
MTEIQFSRGAIDAPGCVSNGWELVKRNYWMYFGICLVAIILAVIPLVNIFIIGPVVVGVYYTLLRDMRGEPVEFGMMFKGFDRFVPAMVVGLLASLPGIVLQMVRITFNISNLVLNGGRHRGGDISGADAVFAGMSMLYMTFVFFMIVLSIVWHLAFFFALPLLAEHDLSPVDAIKLSANAVMSNVGGVVVLILIQVGIGILGALVCCVGWFFILPIVYAANAFAFRQVFPLSNQFQNTPPAPSAFGGQYGQGM